MYRDSPLDKFKQLLQDFNDLVAFKHTIFSLPFIFIAMITAANGWFGWGLLFLGLLAATTARNFAMGVNRFADRKFDALNPRTTNRPSVDGRVNSGKLLGFIILNASGFVLASYLINDLAFQLSIPFLFILGFYSYVKRFSSLAHVFLGIALGLAPIAGVVAVSETITLWSVFLSIGVLFWVAGFDLLYALQDMEFDKEIGLHSIPSTYGESATLVISRIFHLLTILFWFLFVITAGATTVLCLALIIAAGMLGYEHYLVNKDTKHIDKAFFTVNGYLGIIFLIMVILDKII